MPTFHDPLADAAETSEALRGLAHATRRFDQPADTYPVFGDLLAGIRSLRQVLDQLATAHTTHQARAHDDAGNHLVGTHSALAAADELHQAVILLDQVESSLDAAFAHSGRIAWHPEPAQADTVTHEGPTRRWVGVVFLQGDEADEVLDLIDRDGTHTAIERLKSWDYGDETTHAALVNGYVYDEPPTGPLDRVIPDGDYALTYNRAHGHVSLLRQHTTTPDPALDDPDMVPARGAITGSGTPDRPTTLGVANTAKPGQGRRVPDASWFEHPAVTAVKQSRGLSL